MLPLTDTGK